MKVHNIKKDRFNHKINYKILKIPESRSLAPINADELECGSEQVNDSDVQKPNETNRKRLTRSRCSPAFVPCAHFIIHWEDYGEFSKNFKRVEFVSLSRGILSPLGGLEVSRFIAFEVCAISYFYKGHKFVRIQLTIKRTRKADALQ